MLPLALAPAVTDEDVDAVRFVEPEAETLGALSWSFDERPSVRMLGGFLVVLFVLGTLNVEVDAVGELIEYGDDGVLSLAEGSSSGTFVRLRDSVPLVVSPFASGENIEAGGRDWEDERGVGVVLIAFQDNLGCYCISHIFTWELLKFRPSPGSHHLRRNTSYTRSPGPSGQSPDAEFLLLGVEHEERQSKKKKKMGTTRKYIEAIFDRHTDTIQTIPSSTT